MRQFVAGFEIVMGLGIAGMWTADILRNPDIDTSNGLFRARDTDSGSIFWLHWLAEYGTAATLLAGGVGLLADAAWSLPVSLLGVGALIYTSLNSLGWAFAHRERYAYAAPMLVGLIGGLGAAAWLIVGSL